MEELICVCSVSFFFIFYLFCWRRGLMEVHYLSIYLSIYGFLHTLLSIYLSIHLSIFLSIYLSIYLSRINWGHLLNLYLVFHFNALTWFSWCTIVQCTLTKVIWFNWALELLFVYLSIYIYQSIFYLSIHLPIYLSLKFLYSFSISLVLYIYVWLLYIYTFIHQDYTITILWIFSWTVSWCSTPQTPQVQETLGAS